MLNTLANEIHKTAKEKGFWEDIMTYDKLGTKLALVHSEVTEVLEALRKSKGSLEITEEIADTIIRLLDFYQACSDAGIVDHSLDNVLEEKMKINAGRDYLHGHSFG